VAVVYERVHADSRSQQADSEGKATYLESSAYNNIKYYTMFGFGEARDIELKRGAEPVKLHIMVREPQGMAESSKGTKELRTKIRTI
jgi:hypothetical protein